MSHTMKKSHGLFAISRRATWNRRSVILNTWSSVTSNPAMRKFGMSKMYRPAPPSSSSISTSRSCG